MANSTNSAAQTAYEEPSIQLNQEPQIQEPPKKKRGRPAKTHVVHANVDAKIPEVDTPEDVQLLDEVKLACPYQADENGNYGLAGRGWIADEFARRKQALVVTKKDEFDKTFIAEATKCDKRIDKALVRGSESFFEAVKELITAGEKGYHKALGFSSFNSYRESKSQYSRSHIGQGIQAYKALHARIPDDKLATIPIPSAILLTKLPESKLTDEVIEAAATMKIQEFKEKEFPKHASLLVDATTGQPQPIPEQNMTWITRMRVHEQVAEKWKRLLEIAKWKASGLVDEDDFYGNFTQEEKAILCIYFECCKASGWEAEYDEYKQNMPSDEEPAF